MNTTTRTGEEPQDAELDYWRNAVRTSSFNDKPIEEYTDEQIETAARESQECRFTVTPGHLYCRGCDGYGGPPDGDVYTLCKECDGMGELKAEERKKAVEASYPPNPYAVGDMVYVWVGQREPFEAVKVNPRSVVVRNGYWDERVPLHRVRPAGVQS